MRVLLCGGGTAGHVNPALAIAQTIQKNSPSSEFAYVVTKNGIENKLVPYKKYEINIRGIKRAISISNLKTAFLTLSSIQKSKAIIKDFKPDIIVGTGGYACYPVICAGKSMGIKTVVHESNAVPGKALKMLEKKVDRIFLNFKETEKYFECKQKLIYSGNPIREGFGILDRNEIRRRLGIKEKFIVLCYGGSLGAKTINEGAIQLIENLIKDDKNIRFIWASGKKEYGKMYYEIKDKGYDRIKNLEFSEYIYDMPVRMAAADLTINRAGAMTVSELAMTGKAAVFIPSPNVAENHQYKNARVLYDEGAAALFEEKELTDGAKKLIAEVERLLSPEGDAIRAEMGEKIRQFAVKDANKLIYNDILNLIKNKKK